jgi:phospholipase C
VGNVTHGMQWTVDQVNAVVKGGLWPTTAIFITWDDWGGWFDHVDSPELEKWTDGTQFRYGSRVPCLVLSPNAKRGYVSTNLHSHVSLLKFCTVTFGLPTWNQRLAAADDMGDCFDFQQQPGGPPVLKTKTSKSSGGKMTRQSAAEKAYLSHGDCVKIVPLHVPDSVKAPVEQAHAVPPPQLTYRNGPLITAPEVFLLFWGCGLAAVTAE